MEYCAIAVFDISLLARADSTVWDPASVFERLIPRREILLKRNMLHASHLQTYSRRVADDAGTVVTKRSQKTISIYDVALGAKDTAIITINIRPMFDLSSIVANTLREFLEGYANRVSNVDFDKMRLSPLMTALLRQHVREYLGEQYSSISNRNSNSANNGYAAFLGSQQQNDDDGTNTESGRMSSSVATGSYSYYQNNSNLQHSTRAGGSSTALTTSDGNSITSSIQRQMQNETQPLRFGPPVELLSCAPLSVHLSPYGRHAFFPELLERRRSLESQMGVDSDGWRAVVFPPKLLAAVLRIFVVVLGVPARIVLPKLQEVLPGAVEMHYAAAAEKQKAENPGVNAAAEFSPPKITNPKTMVIGATSTQYPFDSECAFGLRYFHTVNAAARRIIQRSHMLSCDVVLILHYTPLPVFGSVHESPLIQEARAFANLHGITVVEKIDLKDQQYLLQVLGNLAKRYSHIFVVYEDINAFGGSPTADVRLVLTRVATNKFTLLVDGTFNVGNACAPARAHWLNSARNAPGSCCGDVYLIGAGAFLPTVLGRAAFAVYSATKCILDIEACLEDPLLPLLVDDAIVVQMELVKAMTAEVLQQETQKAAVGLADDAKEKLSAMMPPNLAPTVSSGIVCIPVPHLKNFAMGPGLRGGRRLGNSNRTNAALFLTAAVCKQLEKVGVSCAFSTVNLIPPPSVQQQLEMKAFTPMTLLTSVSAGESEEFGVLCAIMTPHLQTIEQVPWNAVWKILATGGQVNFRPERVPTLEPAPSEAEVDDTLRKKSEENKANRASSSPNRTRKTPQEEEDAELLDLIRLVLGDNNKKNNTDNEDADKEMIKKKLIEEDRSGETDFIARDPYSYSSRLDNLFARHDAGRTLSAWAIMNGIVVSAEQESEGFMGYRYDEDAEKAAARTNKNNNSAVASTVLKREVIEAAHLARMVLRYGKEPTDNTPLMIAEVLKEFTPPNQFEKFPILIEAYRGKEHQLLESLLEKLVPPHKRGLFRSRPMLLRAPPAPESDVALARRMIHKCFVSHRPNRLDEISSLAHLLAPLVTLVHQKGRPEDQMLSSNPLGGGNNNNNNNNVSPLHHQGTMDFLKEEEMFGVLVRRILEEEIGIVPRAVGSRIGGGRDSRSPMSRSPSSPRGTSGYLGNGQEDDPLFQSLSPAQKARMRAAREQEELLFGNNNNTDGDEGHQDGEGSRSHSIISSSGHHRSLSFLDKMFRGVGGSKNDNRQQNTTKNDAFFETGAGIPSASSRSASLAFNAAQKYSSASAQRQRTGSVTSYHTNQSSSGRNDDDDDDDDFETFHDHYPSANNNNNFSKSQFTSTVLTPKERVIRLYAQYEPAKIPFVDEIMSKWSGREELLISALETKYGPEPPFDAPIRSLTRTRHLTQPQNERPGALVNVIRDYYHATAGPAGRKVIDDALETAYPLEETAQRVFHKAAEDQRKLDEWKRRRDEQLRRQQEWEHEERVRAHMDPNMRME